MIVDSIDKISMDQKVVLFFNELPRLNTPRSGFLSALEYFWNAGVCKRKNVIVVVCGSAASWMIDKVIRNKGGLHGRISKKINLFPFSLAETEEFLKSRG